MRVFSLSRAFAEGWSLGAIDFAVRERFITLIRKSGKLYLQIL